MDCTPPWLSEKDQCDSNITTHNHTKQEISDEILKHFVRLKEDWKPTAAETMCKNPCKKMTNWVSLTAERTGYLTSLRIRFDKLVKIKKKVVVYTLFNFIIDVGSSLGLWLGLSALGITDLTMQAVKILRRWLSSLN